MKKPEYKKNKLNLYRARDITSDYYLLAASYADAVSLWRSHYEYCGEDDDCGFNACEEIEPRRIKLVSESDGVLVANTVQ